MTLIDMLRPEQRQQLRQLRYRIYNREYMRRIREQRKLLCVGVDLPIEAGTCGRLVHAGYQRCIHCTRRRWWLLKHAFNGAEVSINTMLEEHASDNDTLDDAPGALPVLDNLSDLGDPCLHRNSRWAPAHAAFTSTTTPRFCRRRRRFWVTRSLSRSARYRPPRSW